MTILVDLVKGCFAPRYLSELQDGLRLRHLQRRMESALQKACAAKEKELNKASAEYKLLTQAISSSIYTGNRSADGGHDDRGCRYCNLR